MCPDTVVCFLSLEASYLSSFGGGNGSIILDNVECTGEEERLENCTHNGIGHHDCHNDHSEDAGVFCDLSMSISFWKYKKLKMTFDIQMKVIARWRLYLIQMSCFKLSSLSREHAYRGD